VFAAYRDGHWPGDPNPFEDDDEVAVIHAPPEAGGAPLSDAMVDLRATLDAAASAGAVADADRRLLTDALKRRHFPERSIAALHAEATRLLDPQAARRLTAWLPGNTVALKRLDAIAMLEAMHTLTAPFVPDFVMQQPLFWRRFVAAEADALDPSERRVLDRLRRDPDAWQACARAAIGRLPARDRPEAAPETPPHRALGRLRRERGLWRRDDLVAWMEANALDEAGLARLLRREDELDGMAAEETPELLRAMIDHLRLTGAFPALLRDTAGRAQ
jgi:hypothetical protein